MLAVPSLPAKKRARNNERYRTIPHPMFGARIAVFAALATCLAACHRDTKRSSNPAASSQAATAPSAAQPGSGGEAVAPVSCAPDPAFASSWPVSEASAAAEVEIDPGGTRELAVVSDSDNDGEMLLISLSAPREPRHLKLALDDDVSDDVEGMAWRERALYTLTSSGAVQRFVPDKKGGLTRDGAPYPIAAPPLSCPRLADVNCGKNYEGLCLRGASIAARCAGYAASKTDNALYCVVIEGNKLRIDTVKPPLKLALPARALSDCAFGTEGGPAARTLVVTTNIHGGSKSYVVDETTGAVTRIDVPGHVTNEAIAVDRSGALYQFQDDGHSPSAGARAICTGW